MSSSTWKFQAHERPHDEAVVDGTDHDGSQAQEQDEDETLGGLLDVCCGQTGLPRVTGSLWAAVLLHELYDPTGFLSAGGIDRSASAGDVNVALTLAGPANLLCIVIAVVALFLVRGRVQDRPAA
ncbi:hypothetical protein Cpa01nite_03100 [Cellulomonas pakistanensis]|uniref:Uncharacterized protein n=1 Tax=Cellulomonas pakistanensis TaxID=992287 RepID=A0A919U4B9_9CELL|nr:hypothetical protein [Cellulomonas pakistanensis]GIG34929.1 hypothetical protein Cpa01nite_03100 [Cellulomonas pakistanensis]